MENIVFSVWVSGRLEFSADEKRVCFDIAKQLVMLASKARKEGLLSLEKDIAETHDKFLKTALQLAVDSNAPEQIREIMQNWIIFGNYRGEQLLRRIIIIDGVLMMIQGYNPNYICAVLASFFGEELHAEYEMFIDSVIMHGLPFSIENFWDNVKKDTQRYNENSANLLEAVLRQCANASIQVLLRNIEMHDLIFAAKASSEYVIKRILDNVSKSTASHLVCEMYSMRMLRLADAVAAQNRILEKIKELEKRGEIVLQDNSVN